jgi:hypothetical protein
MDLPSIMDSKGRFAPLSDAILATLDEPHAVAYERVKQCADALAAADGRLALSLDKIKEHVQAVGNFEQWQRKTFPKLTHFDLWKQTVKGQ